MSDESSGREPHALHAALGSGAADWADPRVAELLAWIRAGDRRSELQELLRGSVLHSLPAAHAGVLLELLWDWGMVEAGRMISSLPQLRADPEVAMQRARLAMCMRDYAAAIAASDVAIAALLQPGLSIEELLRLCVAGAPAEGMLRFERQVLGSRLHLSERLALRWEALHRAGMSREASMMQLMCQRYFPERASVWATAGNHALDADDLSAAEAYFQRALRLDANWTAGLAGLAIVCERRKDWIAALPYRRRVLDTERALERDDAASLQRRLRYAAALARLGRWREAEPMFRAAVHSQALRQLPAERPVLVRVFSQDLYAPALVAALRGRTETAARAGRAHPAEAASGAGHAEHDQTGDLTGRERVEATSGEEHAEHDRAEEPASSFARHEAILLEQLALALREAARDPREQRWVLALCAYLSGELERAYELLDRAEVDRPDDLALHYLLWRCASASAHPQTASIRNFAEKAARAAWEAEPALSQRERGYAVALVPQLGETAPRTETSAEPLGPALPLPAAVEAQSHQPAREASREMALDELESVQAPVLEQLERIVAFRALHEAAGASPLGAAAASSIALAALLASVTSR